MASASSRSAPPLSPTNTANTDDTSRSLRTFDGDGFRRRAAAIAFQELPDSGERRVLIVASSRQPDLWILPGGGIELGESDAQAAAREAFEEAGAIAAGEASFLTTVDNADKRQRTQLFALRVAALAEEYEDARRRARAWVSIPRAEQLLAAMPAQAACFAAGLAALGWERG